MKKLAWKELTTSLTSMSEEEKFFLFQIEKGWKRKLTRLLEKYPEKQKDYWERLKEEVEVILKMKFPGYFLITQDFLQWADSRGIRRGPGRGSAGGCLIAFLMDITKIDPIKYGLLFSRFLNADRVSMPDIDNDIETDRRDEVKQYLKQKYGEERVASIGTFGTMKVRACIKDIIRSLNLGGSKTEAFKLADQVNSLMPNDPEISFDEACAKSPEFKALVWYPTKEELDNGWQQRIDAGHKPAKFWQVGFHVRKMEGMIRQTGTHAAGVIISPTQLSRILPMAIDKNNVTVTANPGKMVESAGFLKIDLLGLNTLSIIQQCVSNIKKTRNIDLRAIPLAGVPLVIGETEKAFEERIKQYSEPAQQASRAYRLLRAGETEGVFQCESAVAKSLLKDLQANNIEDLAVVLALNRPGPLKAGLVQEFGGRKFGKIDWELPHPATKDVLEPTFGILCFQEQCMQLAVECAKFTMAEADTLRKAIGKKIPDLMVKFEKQFIEGCCKNFEGFDKQVDYETLEEQEDGTLKKISKRGTIAERLWNDIVFFAGYGFNKCLAGSEKITATDGSEYTLEELAGEDCSNIQLYSRTKEGQVVVNQLVEVFCTGENELLEVEFDNGVIIRATEQHKLLCCDGVYHTLREVVDLELDVESVSIEIDRFRMKVKTVKSLGKQKTYNLEMAHPYHNYVLTSGVCTANSHAVAYAHNTYYTAFLKANYPAEFWAAQLSYESDQVKINRMLMEAKSDEIEVLPVSVNTSGLGYEAESPTAIRRSLGTLKSVGGSAIEEMCSNRPYRDPIDLLLKCNMRKLNKKTIHALICAGAFDEFGITRKTLDEKIQDCKSKLDKWCKRRVTAYIKFAGAHKNTISAPAEQDLKRLADPTDGEEEPFKKVDVKYKRIRHVSKLLLKRWLETKDDVKPEEEQTLEEAQAKYLKTLVGKWQNKVNQIFQQDEWEYSFVVTEEDKEEWPLDTIIINEKEVYGTSVSAHVFDKYQDIERKVDEKFISNRFTLDQKLEDYNRDAEVAIMAEVIGLSRQFPYKKDPTKYVRLFTIEDRFGSMEITLFDKQYDDFVEDDVGTPVRVMSSGNIIVFKAKVNLYAGRKSLVYTKCLKLVATGKK